MKFRWWIPTSLLVAFGLLMYVGCGESVNLQNDDTGVQDIDPGLDYTDGDPGEAADGTETPAPAEGEKAAEEGEKSAE